jgi:hypothetical protein
MIELRPSVIAGVVPQLAASETRLAAMKQVKSAPNWTCWRYGKPGYFAASFAAI